MKGDPTIDAIREARHRISEQVNHDPQKLVEYYRKLQETVVVHKIVNNYAVNRNCFTR